MSAAALAVLRDLETQVLALQQLLQAEYEALSGFDPQRLEDVTQDKLRLVDSVNALTERLAEALGLPPGRRDPANLQGRLRGLGEDDGATPSWNRLVNLLRACEHANRRNALMVQRLQWTTRQALRLLGREAPEEPVYHSSGRLQDEAAKHRFGEA